LWDETDLPRLLGDVRYWHLSDIDDEANVRFALTADICKSEIIEFRAGLFGFADPTLWNVDFRFSLEAECRLRPADI
jgi:hypothetical protein